MDAERFLEDRLTPDGMENILQRQIFHLAVSNANLRLALEEIDTVATRKQSGAAKAMQAIARRALNAKAVPNGEHK